MFTEKDVAIEITNAMLDASNRLDLSIQYVQKNCTEDEFDAYRLAAGKILAEIWGAVLGPIYVRHPDIKPADFDW